MSSLDKMFIINNEGKAIPLSYFASWRPANAPLSVNHQGLSAASTISFNLPDGGSLSDATAAVERTMTQLGVPSTVRGVRRHRRCSEDPEVAAHPDPGGDRHGVHRARRAV